MIDSLLQAVGNTPMLKLSLSHDLPGTVWLKVEGVNPGGSIKTRVAAYLIEKALASGELALGGTVVEATSGNMGIGLALVAALRGLKCVLTMPDSMSVERRSLLKALGAELVLTPAAGGMSAAVAESKKIAAERGGWIPGQFTNPLAVQAHYENTGPEIYKDCGGRMDAIVSAVGSGSTLMGAGRYLKEHIPGFRMIAVEPKDSPVLSGGRPGAHVIQGIGAGFVPAIVDASLIDEILTADGEAAFSMARRLMKSDGVVAGISTGANVMAALEVAGREEMRGKNVVTFACDTGERYMSTALFQKN